MIVQGICDSPGRPVKGLPSTCVRCNVCCRFVKVWGSVCYVSGVLLNE